ncbi:MAG: class I SAM-dependent methyltransferase [Verrucomicrobiota bacterium]
MPINPSHQPPPHYRPSPREAASRFKQAFRLCCPGWTLKTLVGGGAAVPTFTSPRERIAIYDEARIAVKHGSFLEIGSHLGASSIVLAEVLKRMAPPDSKLFCIDTWMNDAMTEGTKNTWTEFESYTQSWSKWIAPLRGMSTEVQLPDIDAYDLIFIDGDHSYEGARADADRFAHLVRPGGRLLMHDHDRAPVARVAGELLATGNWAVTRSVGHILSLQRLVAKT